MAAPRQGVVSKVLCVTPAVSSTALPPAVITGLRLNSGRAAGPERAVQLRPVFPMAVNWSVTFTARHALAAACGPACLEDQARVTGQSNAYICPRSLAAAMSAGLAMSPASAVKTPCLRAIRRHLFELLRPPE